LEAGHYGKSSLGSRPNDLEAGHYGKSSLGSRPKDLEAGHYGKSSLGSRPKDSLPLCPPQISHGLTWDRTLAAAVGCFPLTS
jgi:hypothetical protein